MDNNSSVEPRTAVLAVIFMVLQTRLGLLLFAYQVLQDVTSGQPGNWISGPGPGTCPPT